MPLIAGWLSGLTGDRPVGKRACPCRDNLASPLCPHYSFLLLLAFPLLHCLPLPLTVYLSPSVANIGTIPILWQILGPSLGKLYCPRTKELESRNWGRSQGGTSLAYQKFARVISSKLHLL